MPQKYSYFPNLQKMTTLCAADHPPPVLEPAAVERAAPPKLQPEIKQSTSSLDHNYRKYSRKQLTHKLHYQIKLCLLQPILCFTAKCLATHPPSESGDLGLPLAELDGDGVEAGGNSLHLRLSLPQLLDCSSQTSFKTLELQFKLSFS